MSQVVPGIKPQDFDTETTVQTTDLFPFVKDTGSSTFGDRNILLEDFIAAGIGIVTIGLGGQFATAAAAITAGKFAYKQVSNVVEVAGVTIPDNQDIFHDNAGFTWNKSTFVITSTGSTTYKTAGGGKLVTPSGPVKHFDQATTGTIDLSGFNDFTVATSTAIVSAGTQIVSGERSRFSLVNGINSTFTNCGNASKFLNFTLVGAGTACEAFIENGFACLVDDVTFEGTFLVDTDDSIMAFNSSSGATISNLRSLVTAPLIKFTGSKHRLSNITGVGLTLVSSTNCNLSNIDSATLDVNNAAVSGMNLSNVRVASSVTFAGDNNKAVNFDVTGTLDVNGDNNTLLTTTISGTYTDAGNANKLNNNDRVNNQTGTTYTPILSDEYIKQTNGAAITTTLVTAAVGGFKIGKVLNFKQGGAGQITWAPGAGATITSANGLLKSRAINVNVTAILETATNWQLSGDMTAS